MFHDIIIPLTEPELVIFLQLYELNSSIFNWNNVFMHLCFVGESL